MKTKTVTISLKPQVSIAKQAVITALLAVFFLLGANSLKAQYYIVEDFSTANPGFYFSNVGQNEISTDNLSNAGFQGYSVEHNGQLEILQVSTIFTEDADGDWLTPGQNYLYTTGASISEYDLVSSPTISLNPFAGGSLLTTNLVKLTSYTAPSKIAFSDIDFQGHFNAQPSHINERYRFVNAVDETYDPATHGHRAGTIDNTIGTDINPGQLFSTAQGIWSKTEMTDFTNKKFTARSNPRGTIQNQTINPNGDVTETYDFSFSTPIVVGALVFEYSSKPAWWPANTQSQTITFGTTSGSVGGTISAATTAVGCTVSYIVSDPSIAKVTEQSDGSFALELLEEGSTTVLAYVAGDANYDAAIKEIMLTVKTAQTITGLSDINAKVGDAPITLNATGGASGNPVTYSIEPGKESVATLSVNTLTIVGIGTAQITASQAGDDNYGATDITVTLTVTGGSGLWDVKNNASFALQGNPLQNEARFSFESAGSGASIVIVDLAGKTVATENIAVGSTEAVIAVDNLTKGIYIAKYSDGAGKQASVKLVK